HAVLDALGARIGGWKVGGKGADGPPQGAPLPDSALHPSGARITRDPAAPFGLELEIGFRFGRSFAPRAERYTEDEVLAAIAWMVPTIEVVTSRWAGWPEVDRFAQLADLQNHGALIVGEPAPYDARYPFVSPALSFSFAGEAAAPAAAGSNPAVDPRRLLTWLVNHSAVERGIAVTPEQIVTTGSYIGMVFPAGPGLAEGRFDGLPPIRVDVA
ncbi:2-keto-4-pentenoate hydratase, partial [Burkholderia sp. Ac-20379]|uniref:2-keto-4-pentenoate hydratase n=1 Tax=Burkholderia sp. Ac-20379 TaxID=2703900 RepID=UPI0019822AA7